MLVVKNLPASAGHLRDSGSIPRSGRYLEEEITTPSSILAWRIARAEEPGRLQSMGSQKVGYDCNDVAYMHTQSMEYKSSFKIVKLGTSLVVQWLRLGTFVATAWV